MQSSVPLTWKDPVVIGSEYGPWSVRIIPVLRGFTKVVIQSSRPASLLGLTHIKTTRDDIAETGRGS